MKDQSRERHDLFARVLFGLVGALAQPRGPAHDHGVICRVKSGPGLRAVPWPPETYGTGRKER